MTKKKKTTGIEYPENKRLKRMQVKANKLHKELNTAANDFNEAAGRFYEKSSKYVSLLKKIEAEAKMPNFGDR